MPRKGSSEPAPVAADAQLVVVSPDQQITSILPGGSADDTDPFVDALEHVLSPDTKRVYKNVYISFARFLLKRVSAPIPENNDATMRAALRYFPQITSTVIRGYRQSLLDLDRSSSTVAVHLAAISTLFNLMIGRGVLQTNPADTRWVRRPRIVIKTPRHALEPDQLLQLLDTTEEDTTIWGVRDLAIVTLLLYTGLRRREVAEATCEKLTKVRGIPVLTALTKGDKTREVEIIEPAWGILMEWAEAADIKQGPIFRPLSPGGAVLEHHLSRDTIYRIVRLRAAAAGLPQVTPHTLRHTHITLALRGGAKLEDVQLWVGHADPKTTAGYYHPEEFVGQSPARLIELNWSRKR